MMLIEAKLAVQALGTVDQIEAKLAVQAFATKIYRHCLFRNTQMQSSEVVSVLGKIFVAGGRGADGQPISSCDVTGADGQTISSCDLTLTLIGGADGQPISSCEVFMHLLYIVCVVKLRQHADIIHS